MNSESDYDDPKTESSKLENENITLNNKTLVWTQELTDLLIKCRLKNDRIFATKPNKSGWMAVLSDMNKIAAKYNLTELDIRKKWTCLIRTYKECQRFLSCSQVPYSYYYIFENYFKNKTKKKLKLRNDSIAYKCRLCQKTEGVYNLHEDENITTIIRDNISIDISDDPENFPKSICISCKSSLDSLNIFISQCRIVDDTLRNSTNPDQLKQNLSSYCVVLNDSSQKTKLDFTCGLCSLQFENGSLLDDHLEQHTLEIMNEEIENISTENLSKENIKNTDALNDCENKYYTNEPTLEEIFLEDEILSDNEIEEDCNIEKEINVQKQTLKDIIPKKGVKSMNKYTCIICLKQFRSPGELRSHEKHHVGLKHKCSRENCDKVYSSLSSIKLHEMKDHDGIKPYLCTFCGKRFTNRQKLRLHENMHQGIQNYACEFCAKRFFTSGNLHVHRRIYHLGYEFLCSQCPRSFSSKSSLDRHEVVHTGIKDFKCTSCDAAFYTNRELGWHEKRVHKKEKKFSCSVCYKSFHTRYILNVHNRIHTGERPFPCLYPGCEKRFSVNRKMKEHMKIHDKYKVTQKKIT